MHWNFENYKLIFVNSCSDYIVMYIFQKFWCIHMRSRMAEMVKVLKWEQSIGGSSPTEGTGLFLSFTAFEIQ